MASKAKSDAKVPVLKGQEAEDKILEYMKLMNRPFGAVDVAANLKGAVPKATTQKILVALAEKGELTQKIYGKTTFFVINQSKLACLPAEEITTLETELKSVEEENKTLAIELRNASAGKPLRPTDAEIDARIAETTKLVFADDVLYRVLSSMLSISQINQARERLEPLRQGAPPISSEDLAQVDKEWSRWRAEWVRRRKLFTEFWQLATDVLAPQDAKELAEDLGVEWDSAEHGLVERGPLCVEKRTLKRKRQNTDKRKSVAPGILRAVTTTSLSSALHVLPESRQCSYFVRASPLLTPDHRSGGSSSSLATVLAERPRFSVHLLWADFQKNMNQVRSTLHIALRCGSALPPAVFDNYVAEIKLDEKPVQLALWDTAYVAISLPGPVRLDPLFGSHPVVRRSTKCVGSNTSTTADRLTNVIQRLRPMSYAHSHVILIAFALDTPDSLENVTTKWIEEVRELCGPHIPVILVGCKADLRPNTQPPDTPDSSYPWVTREQGERVAQAIGARAYKECSALKIEGVDDVFEAATRASMLVREGAPSHPQAAEIRQHRRRSSGKAPSDETGRGLKCCVIC
ncbi:hypothetical protein NP233_g4793 [Leucocoprinus birnbaumii]|uniref:Homologous-pairing protein 2 winged helix domain-containing protein n=1 Tax=Leucocoprinus birnbaumii TaxID=56174 RepID=A0AAD5YWZ0_9AGAR|nr:hypothetical protein NP233_g4793 [Leucocoprinus birnbaumii]